MARREDISGLDTMDALVREAARVDDQPLPEGPPPSVDALPQVQHDLYDVVSEHGRGGMGRVMVAWDRRLGRPVAIKELLSSRPDATARFVREAMVTAKLQHPSIVPVHEAGRWPSGEPFYTMKLVQGRPLDAIVREKRSFAERLALLPVVIAVAEAVAYAHSRRVIHRDLKPANVVVGDFGETILLDWGLAKELGANQVSVEPSAARHERPGELTDKTVDGAVVGTPGYMSPEQAAGEPVDIRTDVYALGALLYNVLTGELPFRGRTALEMLEASIEARVVPIRERQPDVPDDLVDILGKSMARNPDARYASARELAEDLKRFQTGQLVAAHRYSSAELLKRWIKRHRFAVAVVSAALVIVTAFGALSFRRVVRERDRADQERASAVAARARAEAAREREAERVDELVLVQARAVLDHDPTGALAWLKRLRPGSVQWPAAITVAADARKRGLAEHRFPGHHGAATTLSFSPNGAFVATGGRDGKVRLWPVLPGGEPVVLDEGGEVTVLTFLPDGKQLLSGGLDGRLHLWDLRARVARVLAGHHGAVTALALSPDGARAASVGADGSVIVWELAGGEEKLRASLGRRLSDVAFSLDGLRLAVRGDGTVRQFDASNLTPRAEAALVGDGGLAFSPDGTLAAGGDVEVRLWDKNGRSQRLSADGRVVHVAFSPDGHRLAASSHDGSSKWWDLPSGVAHEVAHKGDPSHEIAAFSHDVTFSRDGTHLAAARGELVRVWVLPAANPRKLRGPTQETTQARFSPDGARLATCSADGSVWVYRLGSGLLPAEPEPPLNPPALRAWLDAVTDATIAE